MVTSEIPATITLTANQSGRLWTDDPAAWAELCSAEGCPMCKPDFPSDGLIAETEAVYVIAGEKAVLPGYALVVVKRHGVEPYQLSPSDQADFFADCMTVARGVAEVIQPVKMNYEIHGNTVPHVHMHLFPRTAGDVYVGYINHCRTSFTRTTEDLSALRDGIRSALGSRALPVS